MEDTVIERLGELIKSLDCNKSTFANKVDIPQASIATLFMRGKTISSQLLGRISRAFPQVSLDWLITGDGDMFKSESSTPAINQEYRGAPYYNVDFIGGFDLVSNDQTTIPDYYIDYPPYNKDGVMWCNVTGHSMEPEIHHGDTMAIKKMNESNINYLPFGEVYAIVTDDYRTVKRISKADKEGFIKLVPSNKSPEYTPQDIPLTMIRAIYQVLVSVKRF